MISDVRRSGSGPGRCWCGWPGRCVHPPVHCAVDICISMLTPA
nr:putative integron gene cassette protein [uncultured bacterium]